MQSLNSSGNATIRTPIVYINYESLLLQKLEKKKNMPHYVDIASHSLTHRIQFTFYFIQCSIVRVAQTDFFFFVDHLGVLESISIRYQNSRLCQVLLNFRFFSLDQLYIKIIGRRLSFSVRRDRVVSSDHINPVISLYD